MQTILSAILLDRLHGLLSGLFLVWLQFTGTWGCKHLPEQLQEEKLKTIQTKILKFKCLKTIYVLKNLQHMNRLMFGIIYSRTTQEMKWAK